MNAFAGLVLLAGLCPALPTGLTPPDLLEAPLARDPLAATVHRLPNGLTVYLSPNPQAPRITAWIAVRAGSKHDPADSTGLAHYLEHMLFKGTAALGTLDYAKEKPHLDRIRQLYERHFRSKDPAERARIYKEIDEANLQTAPYVVVNELAGVYRQLGIRGLNAFTSDEETVYVCDLPSNRLEAWAGVEAERFARPVFRLFQGELETVYEEKNRSLDDAETILQEAHAKSLYKVHPYGQQPTIGTIEHLKNPSLEKMYAFFEKHYVPANMAIVLSGDFDRDAALPLLKGRFGSWPAKAAPPRPSWPVPAPRGRELVSVRYESEEKVLVSWPTVPSRHPDAEALTILDMLLDNAASGIINLTLNQAQRVKAAGSYPSFHNDAGHWTMWALPKLGQTLEEAEALLMEALGRLKRGEFTDEDIKAVITNFEVSEKARLESNESRAQLMADSFLRYEPWPETVDRLARLKKVTREQVLAAARRYLGENRVVTYRRNAKPDIPSIPKPQFTPLSIDVDRRSRFASKILALPAPPIEPRWLAQGRDYAVAHAAAGRLYVAPNPFNDLFTLSLRFELGSRQERSLCEALGLLDLSGAGDLSAEEFKKRLYGLGTSVSLGCGEQESSVSLSGLERNLWPSLELVSRRFEAPNTSSDTLRKMIEVSLGHRQDRKLDPEQVHYALGELAQRGHESAVLAELSDAELRALKIPSLQRLARRLWDTRSRIAYVGARHPGELAKLLDRPGPFRDPPHRQPVRYLKPKAPRVLFTHRDMVQSQVGLFAADGAVDPGRVVDYSFLSSYLGGGMSSVIFQEVREARSLAYAAWGGYGYGDYLGDENMVYAGLGCQADKTGEAVSLLRDLVAAPPWSEARFQVTAKALEEGYRASPVLFRDIPGAVMGWEDLGLKGDPRPARFERLLRYRLSDLQAFAARLKGKPLTLYILGNRDRLPLGELRKLGELEEKSLSELFPY